MAARICNVFPELSESWLLTGDGPMLREGADGRPARHADEANVGMVGGVFPAGQFDDCVAMVDFVPVSATASFLESLADGSSPEIEKYPLVPTAAEKGEIDSLRIFEVAGESMFPTIPAGSLILAKEIPERRWHYAEGVVVAVFCEYVVIKRVARNCLLTENYIILSSDNEGYGDMTVPLCDLRGLYKARRIISSPIR